MIIGNGLIAKEFQDVAQKLDNVIIFGAGVSNSQLQDTSEFEREFLKIKKYCKNKKKFIYFSSIHVLDPSQRSDMYAQHKIRMEEYIKNNFDDFLIFRLPIVVGNGGNKNSLFNYLYQSIIEKKEMNIYLDSYRYIIDIKNVVIFVLKMLSTNNKTINLVFNKPYSIMDIIHAFENKLKIKAVYNRVNGGTFFNVENSELIKNISSEVDFNYFISQKYLEDIIENYYILENRSI